MSSEEHPAQGRTFSRPLRDDETSQFPASGPPRGDGGLFDPDTPVRTLGSTVPAEVAAPARSRLGPAVLGSGPEISRHRGSRSSNGASRARAPFVASPATAALTTPLFERVLDWAYRWRTLLGLGLAAVTTAAVLVAYQMPEGDNLATDDGGPGAESRSAVAAATEFAGTQPANTSTIEPGERQVNSAVDDDASAEENGSGAAPAAPAATTSTAPSITTSVTTTAESSTTTSDPGTETSSTTTPESTTSSSDTTTNTTIDPSPSPSTTVDPTGPTSSIDPTSTIAETTPTTDASTTTTDVTTPAPARTEAETGTVLGAARARSDHEGFSGSGFIGDIITEGSGVSLAVDAVGGPTPFTFRYSASPENGPPEQRTISVLVNGERVTEAHMRLTASWDDWDVVVGSIDLVAGPNVITLVWEPGDTGWVSIDYIEIN